MMYVNLGYNNYVNGERIVAVRPYDDLRLKSDISGKAKKRESGERTYIQDCSKDRKKGSVIICDDGTYFISSKGVRSIMAQIQQGKDDDPVSV